MYWCEISDLYDPTIFYTAEASLIQCSVMFSDIQKLKLNLCAYCQATGGSEDRGPVQVTPSLRSEMSPRLGQRTEAGEAERWPELDPGV